MCKPKLSIITICYNSPYLELTCDSIVNQIWQDFEWIIIDGGSNKDTLKIFEKYKNRINKFISEPDSGIYNACNKGIKLAQGEYLNFMNGGDAYCDNTILQNVFSRNLDEDILYGDEYFDTKCNNIKNLKKMPEKVTEDFLIKSTIRHQSSFIKRKLFENYGLYDENYKIVSDWEKWIVFFLNGVEFKYVPVVVADYNTGGCSFADTYIRLHNKERNEVLNKYFTSKQLRRVLGEKYTIIEQIFSVKNDKNKKHKIITIFGIHIKIKRN